MALDKEIEERFERIEDRLNHASEVLDSCAELVKDTLLLARQNTIAAFGHRPS